MIGRPCFPESLLSFAKDKRGNFAVMTAICLPILLAIAGATFEIARALQIKADMQAVSDSAVLSATTKARLSEGKITQQQMIAAANDYIAASMFAEDMTQEEREDFLAGIALGASKTKTEKGEEFSVQSSMSYNMKLSPLLSLIGHKTLPISVESHATSTINMGAALSLYMLLDRSTSMSYASDKQGVNKLGSLKVAVSYLVDRLHSGDSSYSPTGNPQSTLLRTGAISYNHQADAESPMNWGTKHSLHYANNLKSPSGYTSAVDAMKAAIKALETKNPKENQAHQSKGNSSFSRYIVFMTDGEMTGGTASWDKSIDSSVRGLCENAKQDGITIFTVAFMAPQKGRDLLKACASSTAHYYAPDKMTDLVAAFGEIARKASSKISQLTH